MEIGYEDEWIDVTDKADKWITDQIMAYLGQEFGEEVKTVTQKRRLH